MAYFWNFFIQYFQTVVGYSQINQQNSMQLYLQTFYRILQKAIEALNMANCYNKYLSGSYFMPGTNPNSSQSCCTHTHMHLRFVEKCALVLKISFFKYFILLQQNKLISKFYSPQAFCVILLASVLLKEILIKIKGRARGTQCRLIWLQSRRSYLFALITLAS